MIVGPARVIIPVLAILASAAALGWYYAGRPAGTRPPAIAEGAVPNADRVSEGSPGGAPAASGSPATPPQQSAALDHSAATAQPVPAPGATQPVPKTSAEPADTAADPKSPSFDVVRVEPTGESVIAGRAAPGATVELLRDGQPFARVLADASGLFAFVPPPLPEGTHEIVLQATTSDNGHARSAQSVTVVIAPDKKKAPLVTVTAPDQPTVVLSRPEESGPSTPAQPSAVASAGGAAGERRVAAPDASAASAKRPEIRIASVEAEGSGRLYVSGQAAPGATIRLYLNDAFVAPSGTGPDGRLSFSIERGIRPGDYRVRLDDVDPVTGAVKSRAEVPFNVPAPPPVAVAGAPVGRSGDAATAPPAPAPRAETQPRLAERIAGPNASTLTGVQPGVARQGGSVVVGASTPTGVGSLSADPGQVVVPEVNTAIVARGDNLWRISKRVYGRGLRYTVIYGANTPQIRNPDLIYPGQVFVLPSDTAQTR